MPNVRLDAQGVPKAPVYEGTAPVLHRGPLSAPDAADPTGAAQGLDCAGYRMARFDLDTTGSSGLQYLEVQLLVWNPTAGRYFGGARRAFSAAQLQANPRPSLEAEVRGAVVFLKVTAAQATALSLRVYASLS